MVIASRVKHWHGATSNNWFSHIAIEFPAIDSSNEWLEAVTDEEYNRIEVE
ncbi:hypothetical protein [Mycoplasma sp. P36-A1]|uniref:hypothetical protein n=1 Tax=Mycoplasma sp. P36-A1 TaxID=3252900 RepID=UPI003C2F5BE0